MRSSVIALLVLAAWCIAAPAPAQKDEETPKPPEVRNIRVGFQAYRKNDETAYKVGLWTPVYVELFGGTDGIETRDGVSPLEIKTVDSEDVGTLIRVPVQVKPLETRTVIGYIKIGRQGSADSGVQVNLYANRRPPYTHPFEPSYALDIDAHLYLTLGARLDHIHTAVRKIGKSADEKDDEAKTLADVHNPRHVVFETKLSRLPDVWFGYNSIDLMILTENPAFLQGLRKQPAKLKAIADWVRRGGRLVVPVTPVNQPDMHALLSSDVWDPPIPVIPPKSRGDLTLARLPTVAHWGGVQGDPFQNPDAKKNPIRVAILDPGNVRPGDWEVQADSGDNSGKHPLIAQVRYGLGQITYLAFSLEDPTFLQWNGKTQFIQTMVNKLAPKAPSQADDGKIANYRDSAIPDLATDLLGQLDNFDVKVIPFGYVALFIVLYILVVGPLDFFLLKYVIKRLEWTWITFPAVVLAVSIIAYFAAYEIKGRDLKINKVDIVDFDMRTSSDDKKVHAYGQSFFTILSPRIQNYTIGLEPNAEFWGAPDNKVRSVDLLSWMGRPSGGPHEMGRSGSAGFFRKPYTFRADAAGLEGVPIPVWTTKAFSASWEQTLAKPPFIADLSYHLKEVRGKDLKISGSLINHLGVDLVDVWLIYSDRCYPIRAGLKSVKNGATPLEIALDAPFAKDIDGWAKRSDESPEPRAWSSDPTNLVKKILFHERVDTQHAVRNHLLRPLDLGWRIQPEEGKQTGVRRTREAILFARVRFASGSAEAMTQDSQVPLATKLWLGSIPGTGAPRRELNGTLNQDTYIRVILPVRPADE